MKQIMSSPNLLQTECYEEDSTVILQTGCYEEDSTVRDAHKSNLEDNDDYTLVSDPSVLSETFFKVRVAPSFKDAILLNMNKPTSQGDKKCKTGGRNSYRPFQKANLVVTPIKRRFMSTNDLGALSNTEQLIDGGSTGAGFANNDNEINGESDASEFYARKIHGSVSRRNSRRIRPDEAKRKQMIIFKKELQRQRAKERN